MTNKFWITELLVLCFGIAVISCQKSNPDNTGLYIPTVSDTTAKASLNELQQGRVLYVNNCGECHDYALPENYTPAEWNSILRKMAPKTSLTAEQIDLVTKYVSKGKQ